MQSKMADENAETVGRRLAAVFLDNMSRRAPDSKYCLILKSSEVSDGFRQVTYGHLAQAVNYTSWWIERTFGRVSRSETVSYMAANDIRYSISTYYMSKDRLQGILI
jgi:hypothetical protein